MQGILKEQDIGNGNKVLLPQMTRGKCFKRKQGKGTHSLLGVREREREVNHLTVNKPECTCPGYQNTISMNPPDLCLYLNIINRLD